MRHQILILISLALSVYYGLHTLLFLLLVKFFNLRQGIYQFRLAVILFLLSLSFILAFIWFHSQSQGPERWFYYSSALWLGILVNLLLIFGAGLLLHFLLQLFSLKIDPRNFGVFLLLVTALYTGYGLFQAGRIKTTLLSIPIKNLPREWQGKKIVQLSDAHLGAVNGPESAEKIVRLIDEQKADLIFITGDLLDGTGDSPAKLLEPFKRIDPPVIYITGNHETYLGLDKVMPALERTKIRLLRDEIIEIGGLQIVGVDFPNRGMVKDLTPILQRIDRSKPSILLYHQPVQIDSARKRGVCLQLAGHTHNGQMWPMKIFTSLIYKGFDYGLHRFGDYSIYTTSGICTWGPPLRIGSSGELVVITLKRGP
jgi:predicted MPP superfamily phosphohydrolase